MKIIQKNIVPIVFLILCAIAFGCYFIFFH